MTTEREKCKCSMAISVLGDGCRYCQPQEYIDRLHDSIDEDRKESEQKDKDFSNTVREMLVLSVDAENESKQLKELRTTITELWYALYPESKRSPENDDKAALLRVKNIAQDLKDTRWNYRVLNNAWNKLNEEVKK